ncbi:hypothetical protein EDM00_11945, partial [Ornithobacterium rhinotracheale]|uniref:hypothetical protein n=1 Tax=Ornithobacterium rhinotracheale TaxID=28251 RepID=UPI00129C1DA0
MRGKKSNIFERITQIAEFYGYNSINDFALNGLGYSSSEKINRLKDPTKKPSVDIINDISNKFEINLNWLLNEIGEMTLRVSDFKEEKTKSAKNTNISDVSINVSKNVRKPKVQKKSTNEEVSEIEKGVKLYKGKAIEESEGIPLIPIEAMAGF